MSLDSTTDLWVWSPVFKKGSLVTTSLPPWGFCSLEIFIHSRRSLRESVLYCGKEVLVLRLHTVPWNWSHLVRKPRVALTTSLRGECLGSLPNATFALQRAAQPAVLPVTGILVWWLSRQLSRASNAVGGGKAISIWHSAFVYLGEGRGCCQQGVMGVYCFR